MQSIVFFNIFPQYQYAKLKINKFNFLGYIDYYKRESVNLTKYKKKTFIKWNNNNVHNIYFHYVKFQS